MRWFAVVPLRFRSLFRRARLDQDLDDELRFHLDELAGQYVSQGLTPDDARRAAVRDTHSLEAVKDRCRDTRRVGWIEDAISDVRYAVRTLRNSPGFTAAAVAMLALGIGVNATVFTVTNATLFKGFPKVYRNDRLLYMTSGRGCCVSYPDFEDWRAQARSFQGMALVHGVATVVSDKSDFPESYSATEVSAETFRLVGQRPMLGRDFTTADETPGAPAVSVLSYGLWERRFGKDPDVIGRTVQINDAPATVIGVMADGFSFPQRVDLWVPLMRSPDVLKRENRDTWFVVGRLADGVTVQNARAEMATIGRRLESAYPLTEKGFPPIVYRFDEFFIGPDAATIYKAIWGAVGFVLLIACGNLANLLLARVLSRSREMSVRIALGAGRWRIVRQLLIESLMLSMLGGIFGWWIAKWGLRVYALAANGAGVSDQIVGDWFDHVLDYSMDYRVFGYCVAISIGTGLLFGLAPVSRLWKLDVNAALKDGGRGATGGRGRHLSALLVIAEMALAVVLLAGAGVMVRSFLRIYSADLGFNADHVVATLFSLPNGRYASNEAQVNFFDELKARIESIPGVESVAVGALPADGSAQLAYELAGAPLVDQQRRPTLSASTIGPGYFRTLGAAVLSGRDFNDPDRLSGTPVAIVNQQFANRFWPGEDPLGKRFRLFRGPTPGAWLTVVGMASNVAQNDPLRAELNSVVYLPYQQGPRRSMWVMARSRISLGALAAAFRREVHAIDPALPLQLGPLSLSERLAVRYRYKGITGILFLICAAMALTLSSIGLYAVVAHSVSQRTQEIGIRTAMGATAPDIFRLMFRQGMLPVTIGLAIGLGGALAVTPILKSQLVQVSPADPLTLVTASATLIAAAALGCFIPARRATRVDPLVALRHE